MTSSSGPIPPTALRGERTLPGMHIPWHLRMRVLGIWLGLVLLVILILVVRFPFSGQVALIVGDVAPRDIVAPRQITFASDILTEQRRTMAANAVPDAYDPPQARVGRQQLAVAAQILEYIASVRADSYSAPEAKAVAIRAISGLELPPNTVIRIVSLPAPAWERVAGEALVVLERAMREEIRENNLADERRKVAARVRLDLSDEDASVVSEIVQDLLAPNSFFNAERTEQRRTAARETVEVATTTLERNETILRTGDIVSDVDIEALKALGLQQTTWSWSQVLYTAGFVLLLGIIFLYYTWRQEPQLWLEPANMLLLAAVVVTFIIGARVAIPARAVLPYLFPYAGLTILLSIALNLRVALVVTMLFALVVGWLTGGSVELMTYALAGALLGALKIRRGERLANFAWAALYILAANLLAIAVFRIAGGVWDWRGLLELGGAALANALVSITITLLGLYLLAGLFGLTTALQLLEISRPTHPLLRQLLLKAPGTYHHTLIVSNMAERAAESIGADALLTRVGAYYHDVGKTIRPYFFVENRTEGNDPHSRLDPYTSAQIIVTHVKDGIDLAHKYRLPRRIIDFIPEHQGTLTVSYFYHQAVQQAGSAEGVDPELFRYPGPRPQSRETAITMLADGAEATVRAGHPASIEQLDRIVGESIQNRLLQGQLDECPLTLADLTAIRKAFVDVLRGLHHPRVAYPTEPAKLDATPAAPATSATIDLAPNTEASAINGVEPNAEETPHEHPVLDDAARGAAF